MVFMGPRGTKLLAELQHPLLQGFLWVLEEQN